MKIFNYIFCTMLLSSIMLFTSCKDDEKVDYGPLAIQKVTNTADREIPVNSAELANYILVQGSGFHNVSQILINDVVVDLDETYITPSMISIKIPRKLPHNVNNKITIVTDKGQVQADITINIPPLKVTGMHNEFVLPDSTMTIVGDFFDVYEVDTKNGKIIFGTQELPIKEAGFTWVKFDVPSNAAPGTAIKVKSPRIEMNVPGRFRKEGMMLFDCTNNRGWGGGDGKGTFYAENAQDKPYPSINGDYIRLKVNANQLGWIGEVMAFGWINYPLDMYENSQNYVVKFEVNTIKPMIKRNLIMSFGGREWGDWGEFKKGGTIDTNKEWQTISVSLRTVFSDENGDLKLPNGDRTNNMIQVFANTGIAEDLDICLDNLRIVPKE